MNDFYSQVETHLKNLINNPKEELSDLIYLLGYDYEDENLISFISDWTEYQRSLIHQIVRLGSHGEFSIFWIRLNNIKLIKVDQRTVINRLNRDFPYNMIIFSNKNDDLWDFVNVKAVNTDQSEEDREPTKRQLLRRIRIDNSGNIRTATERLSFIKVPEDGIYHFKLQKQHDLAFDVEKLNKEFYKEISIAFTKLVGGIRIISGRETEFKPSLKMPNVSDHRKFQEFGVRLIGRLVFCWFLKKKFDQNREPLISDSTLSAGAVSCNYYHNVIEPLFFEVLNTHTIERKDKYKNNPWGKIPFLNGGLFEPKNEDYYSLDRSRDLDIPDGWFIELFNIFEQFNFTIEENTSIDIELSIDPEILGRIFENLLAEINPETGDTARKNTGSYYTPRPIVEYMVDESIKQYLLAKTNIEKQKITELLNYSIEEHTLTTIEIDTVIDVLDKLKIIDPACGSGAFPMGILQKMLLILQKIDPESKKWLIKQLKRIPDSIVRKEAEEKLANEHMNYIHKLGIIQNSIYGIDIQSVATEISKLRLFLTLIVDEKISDDKPNRNIHPLPNLEFKFVTANSLVPLPDVQGTSQIEILDYDYKFTPLVDRLGELREKYFYVNGNEKLVIEREFIATQKEIGVFLLKNKTTNNRAKALSKWNPFSNESTPWFDTMWMFGIKTGFDIIIANPPYIRHEKIEPNFKKWLSSFYESVGSTSCDIYIYFFAKALQLASKDGIINFITLNKWLKTQYGIGLRNRLSEIQVKLIIDFFELPIFAASTDTAITVILNSKRLYETKYLPVKSLNNLDLHNLTTQDGLRTIVDKTTDQWTFLDNGEIKIIDKYYDNSTALGVFTQNKIYSGVKTAFNKAFVLEYNIASELLDSESKEIVKDYAYSKDIRQWKLLNNERFFLATGYDTDIKKKYPTAYRYLLKYREQLTKRQDQGENWYNLRACSYYSEFDKDKLIYMHTAKNHEFYLDTQKRYINNSCYMIVCDNKFLFFYLNSKLFKWYKTKKFVAYGDAGTSGRVKLDYNKMINIPIKLLDESQNNYFNKAYENILKNRDMNVSNEMITAIDQELYKIFELNNEEIKIIEGSI